MPDKKGDTTMSFVKEKNRITYVQNGEMLAEITFPALENDENTVNIDHTFVNDVLRGQGVAGRNRACKIFVQTGIYASYHLP